MRGKRLNWVRSPRKNTAGRFGCSCNRGGDFRRGRISVGEATSLRGGSLNNVVLGVKKGMAKLNVVRCSVDEELQ